MATTIRSSNHSVEYLGLDSMGNQVSGIRQTGFSTEGFGLWFRAATEFVVNEGVDDFGLYLVSGGVEPQYVLAGWVGAEVARSEPFTEMNDHSVTEFVNQVHSIHNRTRRETERRF